jgi:hypothetical protein
VREEIEEASPQALKEIGKRNETEIERCIASIAHHFNEKEFNVMEKEVVSLQYLLRIQTTVDEKLEKLMFPNEAVAGVQ